MSDTEFTFTEDQLAFLEVPRQAIFISNRKDGTPVGVPVWYEWTGSEVHMFSATTTAKVKRVESDPRASVLVTNTLGEPELWVAFDGQVQIEAQGGIELAERLAPRYWDVEEKKATLDMWRQAADADLLCLLKLTPDQIRWGQ